MGNPPDPKLSLNPADQYIKIEVLKHYASNGALSVAQTLAALNKHVRVIRFLPDEKSVPIIPSQSKDVDWQGLFMSSNPAVRLQYGPSHPLAYHYNGLIPGANGFAIFLDEVGKNPMPLIHKFLNIIQERTLSEGGVPPVPVDVVLLMASNHSDLETIREKDPDSAFLDRLVIVPQDYPLNPHDISKTLLYQTANLWMTPLAGKPEERVAIAATGNNLDELIPDVKPGATLLGPDGRFSLHLGDPNGEHSIHISPQGLMWLSQVASLTRQSFDQAKAGDEETYPVIKVGLFRDPITRLRARMGMIDNMTSAQRVQLHELSRLMREGTFGLTERDTSKVFLEAAKEAQKKDGCITPTLLLEVMKRLFVERKLPSAQDDWGRWLQFAQGVLLHFTVKAYKSDIRRALTNDRNNPILARMYDEVVAEMLALHADSTTKEFDHPEGGRKRAIHFERLESIQKIYLELQGRPLNVSEIAMFETHRRLRQPADEAEARTERDPALLEALATWQGDKLAQGADASFGLILSLGTQREVGTDEQKGIAEQLLASLKDDFGYCDHCARHAMELVRESLHRARTPESK